jgi:hypothetical protein
MSMAKQVGDIKVTGTIEDICFYRMEGNYYVRMKSSLTGKRFWRDKAFEGSRRSCARFASGNRLASQVYRSIEKKKRYYPIFCSLKTRAIELIRKGLGEEDVINALQFYLQEAIHKKTKARPVKKKCRMEERSPVRLNGAPLRFALPVPNDKHRRIEQSFGFCTLIEVPG